MRIRISPRGWLLLAGLAASLSMAAPAFAAAEKTRKEPAREERPQKEGPQKEHPGFLARLDADGDGKVSRDEFDGPPEHFADFDRNRDGFIAGDEAPKGPPPRRPGPARFIERLDQDGDGKVSREEFDGPEEHFDDFDENGDGFIERSEAPAGPPPGPPPGEGRRRPERGREEG